MKSLAVIGYPIKHSISPPMQQAALDACRIDARYVRREVAPEELPGFVVGLRGVGWVGVNVTVPHKEAVIPHLDGLSAEAEAIGAVNTIVFSGDTLVGHNTDAAGFLRALKEDGRFDPAGQSIVLLGAGGAARAVLWTVVAAGAASVWIFNRHLERAERLAQVARGWGARTVVVAHPWDADAIASRLADCGLLVNATSVGLKPGETPLPGGAIPGGALVADLIYNPRPTRLLRDAAARGARTLDGLPMLVYQGASAFELWTGTKPPVEAMFAAAERALEGTDLTPLPPSRRGKGENSSPASGEGLHDA